MIQFWYSDEPSETDLADEGQTPVRSPYGAKGGTVIGQPAHVRTIRADRVDIVRIPVTEV